jgi:hypothetical protein
MVEALLQTLIPAAVVGAVALYGARAIQDDGHESEPPTAPPAPASQDVANRLRIF